VSDGTVYTVHLTFHWTHSGHFEDNFTGQPTNQQCHNTEEQIDLAH